jgi:hypothetical protein
MNTTYSKVTYRDLLKCLVIGTLLGASTTQAQPGPMTTNYGTLCALVHGQILPSLTTVCNVSGNGLVLSSKSDCKDLVIYGQGTRKYSGTKVRDMELYGNSFPAANGIIKNAYHLKGVTADNGKAWKVIMNKNKFGLILVDDENANQIFETDTAVHEVANKMPLILYENGRKVWKFATVQDTTYNSAKLFDSEGVGKLPANADEYELGWCPGSRSSKIHK